MTESTAIINPYRSSKAPKLGHLAVMVATRNDIADLVKQLAIPRDQYQRIFTSRLYRTEVDGKSLTVAGPMMGAPYAVAILETLIAWGARKILFWGWCGGIVPRVAHGDLILPSAALSAEGTSRHYQPSLGMDDPVQPSASLLKFLGQSLDEDAQAYHLGTVWTTDAIYRETREQISRLQHQDILAVEMELSALFTVARFRGVELAAGLVVSDDLSTLTWRPGFNSEAFSKGRDRGLGSLIACCRSLL